MVESYDVLKEKNLRQIVKEYENERKKLSEKCAKERQQQRDWMKKCALEELERIRDKEDDFEELAEELFWEEPWELHLHYNPNAFMWEYTEHVYDNAWAALVRKYATIHDAKNLDKYPKPTPLPKMEEVWNPYFPFNYWKLKELAAHCSRWRQK